MDEVYRLPLFPLHTVLFPGQTLPLHIFEPRYQLMVHRCLAEEIPFGVVLIQEGVEVGGSAIPYTVGTLARITDVEPLSGGRMNITAVGEHRFHLHRYDETQEPYLVGDLMLWPWGDLSPPAPSLLLAVQSALEQYLTLLSRLTGEAFYLDEIPLHPATLAVLTAITLQVHPREKQRLLEQPTIRQMLEYERQLLKEENQALQFLVAAGPPPEDEESFFFSIN